MAVVAIFCCSWVFLTYLVYKMDYGLQYDYTAILMSVLLVLAALYWDRIRRAVVIMYDMESDVEVAYAAFSEAFATVAKARRIWNVDTSGDTDDWKRNAGARSLIKRSDTRFSYGVPSVIKTNVDVPCIVGGKKSVYFFPDVVLVTEGRNAGAISYGELTVDWGRTTFVEDGRVPSDSMIVGHTWQFVNKKGGPDRRFKNNKKIPEVLYQTMTLGGPANLRKILHLSCIADRSNFDKALRALGSESSAGIPDAKVDQTARSIKSTAMSWRFPPNPTEEKNKVGIYAVCSCGETLSHDDEWSDDESVVCSRCGANHGTFGNFKKQASAKVHDFIKGRWRPS